MTGSQDIILHWVIFGLSDKVMNKVRSLAEIYCHWILLESELCLYHCTCVLTLLIHSPKIHGLQSYKNIKQCHKNAS